MYHVDDIAMPKDIDAKEYCGTDINEALLKQLICGGATGSSPQPITERLILVQSLPPDGVIGFKNKTMIKQEFKT